MIFARGGLAASSPGIGRAARLPIRRGSGPFLLFAAILAALFAFALTGDAAAKESQYVINVDKPTPDWRLGPVRYIITKEEDKTYKSLKDEQDRANFIDIFWRRRDPTPRTDYNEFKEKFRNRALDANRLYAETAMPGWKTDMGKVYILLGPPDEMVRDRVARSKRGTVMWIYRTPPFRDLSPNTVVAFAQNPMGDYELSIKPTWDSDVAHGLVLMGNKATDPEFNLPIFNEKDPLLLSQGVPYSQSEFETQFIYGRMQQLPPKEAAILHDVVVTRQSFDAFPFKSRYAFFKTDSSSTLVAITLAIKTTSVQYRATPAGERPDVGLFGKLVNSDDPTVEVALSSAGAFAAAPQNEHAGISDYLLFQAVAPVKPGRYQAVFAAEDRVAQKVGSFREPLIVPDLAGGGSLLLSSVVVARSVSNRSEGGDTSPFAFGSLNVVQAPETRFKVKETLNIYYQIYNATRDPAGEGPSLDIDYDYFALQPDGDVALGNIHLGPTPAQVQAYSLPLERFPTGEYKLRITVTDRVAGVKTTTELPFTIVP